MTDSAKRMLTFGSQDQGQRLDRQLSLYWSDFSRMRLKNLILAEAVSLNGQIMTNPSYKCQVGQQVILVVPEARSADPEPENIPLDIFYEDSDVIVLNKGPGMVVHPAPGNESGTLVNALLYHCGQELSGIGGVRRPGIVHRLDKDTSGLMVVAKNDKAHHGLSEQFANHSLQRAYQALVWGCPTRSAGRFESAIGRHAQDRKKMSVVSHGGKWAATNYRVLQNLAGYISLVECRLETGRTHQIRVHLSHAGHPLIGDDVYGRMTKNRKQIERFVEVETAQKILKFPRQALHAWELGFIHPVTEEPLRFTNQLPEDMQILIRDIFQ